jgi:hypothetical protein
MSVDYIELARILNRAEFVTRHAGHFLLKRAKAPLESEPPPAHFDFETEVTSADIDPFAHEWQVLPVVKRPDNPFPERMTVGRAVNCDLVLRVPFVSKVHAHILFGPEGGYSLHDNRPSHATFHNRKKLEPGATLPLAVGDFIGFGSLEFQFLDAGRLHEILRAEALAS